MPCQSLHSRGHSARRHCWWVPFLIVSGCEAHSLTLTDEPRTPRTKEWLMPTIEELWKFPPATVLYTSNSPRFVTFVQHVQNCDVGANKIKKTVSDYKFLLTDIWAPTYIKWSHCSLLCEPVHSIQCNMMCCGSAWCIHMKLLPWESCFHSLYTVKL